MKKIKNYFPVFMLVVGVVFATAAKRKQSCTGEAQYYWNGSAFVPAGKLGTDYICLTSSNHCTYITAGNFFVPCQTGTFMSLQSASPERKNIGKE